jgi:primary-amine oxidase
MPKNPFEPLTAEEIAFATAAVKPRLTDAARFSTVTLDEPPKNLIDRVRMARLVIVPGPHLSVIEASVRLDTGEVDSWIEREGVRAALGFEESFNAIVALHAHDGFKDALAKRGILDLDKVQIDPWPTGNFGIGIEDDRRVVRCIMYYRENPTDNGYARPIEGLLAWVDMARGEVLEVRDLGDAPMPSDPGSYYAEHNGPQRSGLKPVEITQPDGPSFTVDGSKLDWQKWSLRASMDPLEGLVLHQVSYDGRSIAHRMAISEMVVPYGDPGPMHNWKNAFDAGEWGLGRMAQSLALGCDCLGEIRYLDWIYANEHGDPAKTENAICIHEEDYGILWKHVDLLGGRTEVRRQRRLVVSFISTVGNYEYGFYWYFYLDGSIQLEVKLTGILSTGTTAGADPRFSSTVAPGLAAAVHQHMFCARLDLDIDGDTNEIYEVNVDPVPTSVDNPLGNAFEPTFTRLDTEYAAQRMVDPSRARAWKIVNPNARNVLGQPVGYKLIPGATPALHAQPDSSIAKRAAFATKNLWVTPYAADERRAAGDYPNQHAGGDGLPRFTASNRSLVDADIVVWHTFGVTHIPRPEDWPVMPVESCGFHLVPVGFFDKNPALDVPPPTHCEHE